MGEIDKIKSYFNQGLKSCRVKDTNRDDSWEEENQNEDFLKFFLEETVGGDSAS